MLWDPFGTVRQTLWIGGAQWAGKSTVANLLAARYEITAYHYDYHDARGHRDRRIAQRVSCGQPPQDPDLDSVWVNTTPEQMATDVLAGFAERFAWVLDDLRALVSGRPIVAEGWGLRPDLVTPIIDSPRRMIVMVPSPEFRQHQIRTLPRAAAPEQEVSDSERAQRNRLARDHIVAEDALRSARHHGVRVLVVDGRLDVTAVADTVADHFGPYLRPAARPPSDLTPSADIGHATPGDGAELVQGHELGRDPYLDGGDGKGPLHATGPR